MKNIEKLINDIDITVEAPITEPERQYYFIKKAREYVAKASEEIGRKNVTYKWHRKFCAIYVVIDIWNVVLTACQTIIYCSMPSLIKSLLF